MVLVRIPTLSASEIAIDERGRFTTATLRTLNAILQQLAEAINAIAEIPEIQEALANAQDAIVAAQDAADAANAAAANAQSAADQAQGATDAVASEISLNNSYPADYVEPLFEADEFGNITIADHKRIYGDQAIDPTVDVDAGSVNAAGVIAGQVVRVFYDDPSRNGGVVTYQFTTIAAQAAQTGSRHSIGSVRIPSSGAPPIAGTPTLPPGGAYPG